MNVKQKYKFKKFIKELESVRGRHTELVSVYIPQGYNLDKIINHLFQEQGTASNIKDPKTKKNVIDSLEKLIRHLRLYKKTPENGLAVFAGNISSQEGKVDLKVWSIEPPEPVKTRLYRCDHVFVLDILKDMMDVKYNFGLLVIDKKEASIGLLRGTNIKALTTMSSGVPGKTRAGGQSAARFERLREIAARDFYKRIGDTMKKEFFDMGKELKAILIGGPGHTKNEFLSGDFLVTSLKDKVLGMKDLSYTGEFGLQELVDRSGDLLAKEEITKEKKIMERFFMLLAKEPNKVVYGGDNVEKALESGAAEVLLISEGIDDKIAEELEEKASKFGTETEIISVESREGVQFKELSGIAVILRYVIS